MAAKVLQRLDILLFANTAQYRSEMRDTQQSTQTLLGAMRADAVNLSKVGAAAFTGFAAAGTAAVGAMIKEQIELGNEMTRLSRIANTSVEDMQKLAFAAKAVGVEQDTLGDIYKDTQDKIGDFLSTGGGAMADYFENVAPLIGQTAEEFRTLSGPEALQKYYNGLQEANLSQSEMIFYLEGIASDASALIPLLHDNGAGFDVWAQAAENAGAVMSEKTIRATQELQASNDLLMLSYDGAKKQFTQALIPVLSDVAGQLVSNGSAADFAREAGEALVTTLKFVAKAGLGVTAVFRTTGQVVGGVFATVSTLLDGVSWSDGALTTAVKIARNGQQAANVVRMAYNDVTTIWSDVSADMARIDALGTGTTNKFVATVMAQNTAQQGLNRTLGITGQQYQAQKDAAEAAAKATQKQTKAVKELGAAYVSNATLSGLKLKSNEAIAGGMVRGYTAEFAEVTQSVIGNNLKYFSALNDTYHKGTNSKHASGQAFDVVLKDAKQAAVAAAIIEQAAKKYGYNVKVLNEYAKPSKRSTGGHLHVSVLGQTAVNNGGADLQYIRQQNTALAQEQQRAAAEQKRAAEQAAAEQARIEEQQKQSRIAIRLDFADEATRIEEQLKTDILKIDASGFSADERDAFIGAAIDRANQRAAQLQLTYDQAMQQAQQYAQTESERISKQYALERREIELTVNYDAELRKAKIAAVNAAEQAALDELRYSYERELSAATDYGLTELQRIRAQFAQQRAELDRRTDIDDTQKSSLRNAMAGSEIFAVNQVQQPARDAFNAQQAEFAGQSEQYALSQELAQQLTIIENAKKAELLTVEQYEQAKYAAQEQYQQQTQQMMIASAGEQFGSVTALMRMAFGEQNALYQVAFHAQKGMAIAQALLNIPESYSQAFNAVVGIPYVGPALAPVAGAAAAAMQVAQKAMIENVQQPSIPGFMTGGYTGDIPTDQVAGLVHGQEHVSNAATTKRYRPELNAMHDGTYESKYRQKGQGVNINIINNAPVNVTASANDDGSIDVRIDQRINERVPQMVAQQINTPASPVHSALTNNFNLERRF